MALKPKTVTIEGKTYIEVGAEGRPIYLDDAAGNKEVAFDVEGTAEAIRAANSEAAGHRRSRDEAKAELKKFEGLDPDTARDAIEKVKKIGNKELLDAGKAEEIRVEAIRATEEKYKPVTEERDRLKNQMKEEKIGGSFARSQFVKDKLAIPADIAQARFEKHFEIGEDGVMSAKDGAGNVIYSKANPGKPAEFDEAIEILVDHYPQKDSILKGAGQSGGGKKPGDTGFKPQNTISRAEFEKLPHHERPEALKTKVIAD